MKKRMLAALLAAVILLTLAGCANNNADAPAPDTTRPTVTATVETTGTAESDTDTEHTEEKKNSTAEETKPAETTKTQEPSESVTEQTETKPAATKPQTTEKPESESKPAETVPKETEQKPTETKPAETKPPQTEQPKAEETKVTEPTETEPAVTMPTRPTASEIEPLVAKYLNDHRATVGASSMTVLSGLTEVARFRAEQLITNFSHQSDPDACTVLQYGEFIDMTELGLDASHNYYQGYDAEACAKGNWSGSAEDIARRIADGFRNSSGHWRYLGSSEYTYMAVGLTYDSHTAKWYCCVCVSSKNYGG